MLFSSFADVVADRRRTGRHHGRRKRGTGLCLPGDASGGRRRGKTINRGVAASYAPDFVICSADLEEQVKTAEFLQQHGIPAAVFHVEEFQDYLDMLKICTDITGNREAYETYGIGGTGRRYRPCLRRRRRRREPIKNAFCLSGQGPNTAPPRQNRGE